MFPFYFLCFVAVAGRIAWTFEKDSIWKTYVLLADCGAIELQRKWRLTVLVATIQKIEDDNMREMADCVSEKRKYLTVIDYEQ